jgi:hypothetical protein
MRINHEETKRTKKRPEKTFVLFVSSWLILGGGNLFDHKNTKKSAKATNILQVFPSPVAM